MHRRHRIGLGLSGAALILCLLTALLARQPGYTDAYYYAVGTRQLYAGHGFSEPFIWNYLDPPPHLPHPGYQYWMPLPAIIGWVGALALGGSFLAIQIPFVLISALLPLVAYVIAWDLTRERRHALLAGGLGLFPGFYTYYLVLPDTVAPFALAGSVCLWALGRGLRDRRVLWFGLAGLAAGLAHLARADGLLLMAVALVCVCVRSGAVEPGGRGVWRAVRRSLGRATVLLAAYLVIMGPWFLRTWHASGAPLSPAGTKTLFLSDYDELFTYGHTPTLEGYLESGWDTILGSKARALGLNLQRLWVLNLLVFLPPLVAAGLWRLRRDCLLWPFFLYAPALFALMTFAFTFPGMRGGLFHSGGALLPFFLGSAGLGLDAALRWAGRRFRGWHPARAWPVFSVGLVGLAAIVTSFALWRAGLLSGDWNKRYQGYALIGTWLAEQGAAEAIVMVGDAPAFTWHTGHMAIAVPNNPLDTVVAVADHYDARYLVLDASRPRTTDGLFRGEASHPRLRLRRVVEANNQEWQLYEILPQTADPAGGTSTPQEAHTVRRASPCLASSSLPAFALCVWE